MRSAVRSSTYIALTVLAAALGCSSTDSPQQPGGPGASGPTTPSTDTTHPPVSNVACDTGNGSITLPAGFCATVFADVPYLPRHITVAPNGDLYGTLAGGAVLALRDTNGDGHADLRRTFGNGGGTGIALRGTSLYEDNGVGQIVRFQRANDVLVPTGAPDTIVRDLPTTGHGARNFVLDSAGALYVNVGSVTNICETGVRDPCAELPTRAGIWRFDATRVGQTFSQGVRVATGLRNAVGMALNPADGKLYATQHGRDNLYQSYPRLFTAADGAENPAEELIQVNAGDDFGWPYCYFDLRAGHLVLGPEYGGDRVQVGRCSSARAPLVAFPGHWAPNGLLFYTGTTFPAHYRGGAFVAFHGSWNRAPQPQAGFRIAFVPATGGTLGPAYETFADGFAGSAPFTDPADAAHRPTGLAQGPDGALYVSDDRHGRIWKIVWRGP